MSDWKDELIEALRAKADSYKGLAADRKKRIAWLEAQLARMREPVWDDPVWLRNEVRRQREVIRGLCDELHPLGRCTCGGEGRCDWCQRACPACGTPAIEHGDACSGLGVPDLNL